MEEKRKFVLPGSTYDAISKILHSYALCGDTPVSLDELAIKAGMNKITVSRNHGFLIALGLVTSGKSKSLTEHGKKIAIAISNNLQEDEAVAWRESLLQTKETCRILDMLKIQKAIPKDEFVKRIASSLGELDSASTRVGINSLIEVFLKSGLIVESDGNYSVPSPSTPSGKSATEQISAITEPSRVATEPSTLCEPKAAGQPTLPNQMIPIHVNIELHLPASSEQSVYDALFKSIRENLMR